MFGLKKSDCHHANSYVSDVHLCDMGDSSASYHYSIVYLSNNRIIENKTHKLIPYALCFAAKKPGYAICIALLTCLPMYFTLVDAKLFPVYLLVWLMCGFSMTAYGNSWFCGDYFAHILLKTRKNCQV